MSNPFEGTPFESLMGQWSAMISKAVEGTDYLQDTPEQRQRDAQADDLARRMED